MSIFPTMASFLDAVRASALSKRIDERILAAAPSTSGSEAVGADGGFAVPAELWSQVTQQIAQATWLGRCTTLRASRNNLSLPADPSPPWEASGVYWDAELDALTQIKPAFTLASMRLNRATCFVPVSDELLEDSALFDGWALTALPARIAGKLQAAVINGTGVGMPRGILADPALITVSRGGSVTATAAAMWKRLYPAGRANAIWLVGPDVDVPTTAGLPMLLHGQPVIASEQCAAAGQANDMLLVDLSQYTLLTKALATAVSAHVFFDVDASCYRFILRVAGQGAWDAPASLNGSTVSPFVTVAA